jgi:hypothetical protein
VHIFRRIGRVWGLRLVWWYYVDARCQRQHNEERGEQPVPVGVPAGLVGHWLRPVVEMAPGTGMRRGELCALKWDAVDPGKGRPG